MVTCNSSDIGRGNREFGECSTDDPSADSIWILTSTFIIFTMQSGFGLLESGSVSQKNEVNIMVKNAVDVIFGGLTYWMFGYGLSFGDDESYSNAFNGWGKFFVKASEEDLGWVYSKFFFQASFATTATTIVSGAMAERTKLESYIIFSMLNTFVYCLPAHWVWGSNGWLQNMGVVDIAGAGPVHVVGGVSGFMATIVLKPRHNRYTSKTTRMPQMGSPTNALLGMFMLWWGWLGFNCGSTFGISGLKWKLAARSAVSTISASMAGGFVGLLSSYIVKKRTFNVAYLINGILGGLVGITATCAMVHPYEGFIIGMIGSLVTLIGVATLDRCKVDDPVGCVGTHALGGIWSMLAGGLFSRRDTFASELDLHAVHNGAFNNGGFHQLGVQCIAVLAIVGWTLVTSFIFLKSIQLVLGLRIPLEEEKLGADLVEHGIGNYIYDKANKKLIELEISPDEEMEQHIYNSRISRRRSTTHTLGKHTDAISTLAALTMANLTLHGRPATVSEKKVTSKLGRMIRRINILNLKTKKKAARDVKVQLESSQIMQNGFRSSSPTGNHNHGFENGTIPPFVNDRIRDERNDHRFIAVSEYESERDDSPNQEPRYFSQMTYI